jgi:hypothetical protein
METRRGRPPQQLIALLPTETAASWIGSAAVSFAAPVIPGLRLWSAIADLGRMRDAQLRIGNEGRYALNLIRSARDQDGRPYCCGSSLGATNP